MNKELLDVTEKSGYIFIGKIFGIINLFLFNFIVARLVGSDNYGNFIYAYTFISFFPIICTVGLEQAMVFHNPAFINNKKYKELNSLVTFSVFVAFIISLSCAVLLTVKSNFVAEVILNNRNYSTYIEEIAPLIIFISISNVFGGIFRGFGNVKHNIISENFISPIVKIFSVILLVYLGFKRSSIELTFYASFILSFLYLAKSFLNLGVIGSVKFEFIHIYKDALKFGLPVVVTGILGYIVQRVDIFVIGFFLSSKDVGIYNIAVQIGTVSSVVLVAFNTIFASNISSLHHKGDSKTLAEMYKFITKWVVFVNLMIFGIILIFSSDIMHLFGSDFMSGASALIFISMGQVVNSATGSVGVINTMTGHPHYEIYICIIVVIISIVLNYVITPIYGISGTAFVSFIVLTLSNLLKFGLMYKDHKMHPYNLQYIKVIFSFILSLAASYSLKKLIIVNWIVGFVMFSLFYIGLFLFLNYLLKFSVEDKKILNGIIKKMRIKIQR